MRLLILVFTMLAFGAPSVASAATTQQTVQTTWRLLDYVAVDYGGAVAGGKMVSASEFAEMQEFSATITKQVAVLPQSSAKASLLSRTSELQAAIARKAPAESVAGLARRIGADLLRSYPVPLAPPSLPDLSRGADLYRDNCSSCHGAEGRGNGPAALTLNPKPVNFTDRGRASERSVFALEQVIDQGLDGTAMPSFASLSSADRWALAFKAGTFAYGPELAAQGKRIWESDAKVRHLLPDLASLAAVTPKLLSEQIGEAQAVAVIAYLRAHPRALAAQRSNPLAVARSKVAASIAAYAAGDREEAKTLALSAYLDGFEPIEPTLAGRDGGLLHRVEAAMGELRSKISRGNDVAVVQQQGRELDGLFNEAEQALAPAAASSVSTFLSALTILLREGVEALLIVVAMVAFLRKSGRLEAMPFVHAGWVAALLLGGVTWFIATTLISVSGASREITEGVGGIFAAFVLVFVGIWMHGKANADAWQRYVREKMDRALSRGSGWFLFGLAFVVVYREVFETILFYAAMWEDAPGALLGGVALGAVLLAVIAWLMLRYSAKLPITQFFRYSSLLMAVLAVILAGKGVAAIQEAGLLGITPVSGVPRIDALGVHPSVQVLSAQLLALLTLVAGFRLTRPAQPAGNR